MTPVTLFAPLLAVATLAAGALTGVPALAGEPTDPVSGLVGGLVGPSQHDRQRDRSDYGHTHAADGRLVQGCHNYRYRYVVTTPTDDWTIETFLDDRTGETIASGAFSSDADPARNRTHFRFCRYSTYAGKFTIRAKVYWYNGSEEHKVWLEPSHFRLRRP